jgi:hypothetical protein
MEASPARFSAEAIVALHAAVLQDDGLFGMQRGIKKESYTARNFADKVKERFFELGAEAAGKDPETCNTFFDNCWKVLPIDWCSSLVNRTHSLNALEAEHVVAAGLLSALERNPNLIADRGYPEEGSIGPFLKGLRNRGVSSVTLAAKMVESTSRWLCSEDISEKWIETGLQRFRCAVNTAAGTLDEFLNYNRRAVTNLFSSTEQDVLRFVKSLCSQSESWKQWMDRNKYLSETRGKVKPSELGFWDKVARTIWW